MGSLVFCQNVTVTLPTISSRTPVLHAISLAISEGSHCALFGKNGSGKSTLLALLAGFLWPATGRISWVNESGGMDDSPLTGRAITSLVAPATQLLYQRQGWHMTGLSLIKSGLDGTPLLYTQKSSEEEDKARALAESLACSSLLDCDIAELSQGQLRILLLCRAMIKEPKLLLLDECMEGLDSVHVALVHKVLERCALKTTICYVSHTDDAPSFCQQSWFMEEGRLFCAKVGKQGHKTTSLQKTHADTAFFAGEKTEQHTKPVFLLDNATVFLDGTEVLHGINWRVEAGEYWGIEGTNGSGKTTLLRLLHGDVCTAAGGSIRRWLYPDDTEPALIELRTLISLVSSAEEVRYDYPVNVLEFVCSGYDKSIGIYREYTSEEIARAKECIARFFPEYSANERASFGKKSVFHLSTGQLRRLFLARALIHTPRVLLLDEPLSGLDAESRTYFSALLTSLLADHLGILSVIYVSHEKERPTFLNRFATMEDGYLKL